jgi:5-methylcytosine-specific restriction endonuclease McrA
MSSGSDEGQVVVCTDPSLWDEGYEKTIANISSLPQAWTEDLREAFNSQTGLAESRAAGHLEQYQGPVVTGEITRFSSNDNAVVSIESEEYVLQEETEEEVGDTIPVRFGNDTFVTRADVEPGGSDDTDVDRESRSGENHTARSAEPEVRHDTSPSTSQQTSDTSGEGPSKAESSKAASEPELTDDAGYTETRRRERDPAFTENVRDAYDERCAVCGERRVTPDGSPEVEAAHIYPKSEGGVDEVQNGVALCKLHHWAFDAGWISFTDDHEIIVRDAPEQDQYLAKPVCQEVCLLKCDQTRASRRCNPRRPAS